MLAAACANIVLGARGEGHDLLIAFNGRVTACASNHD